MRKTNVIIVVIICAMLLALNHFRHSFAQERKLRDCSKEIGAAFETIYSLACVDGKVVFAYNSMQGRELRWLDPSTDKVESIPLRKSVMRLFSGSPEGTHLLLKEVGQSGGSSNQAEWVTSLNLGSFLTTSTYEMATTGKYPVWLDNDVFLFFGRAQSGKVEEPLIRTIDGGPPQLDTSSIAILLKKLSFNASLETVNIGKLKIAFEHKGELNSLDFSSYDQEILSNFQGRFLGLQWLRYSKSNQKYLFCATEKDAAARNLFMFDPQIRVLTRLTEVHTYNGQWLKGNGYAFVGSTNNSFYLAIRPENPTGSTNLFAEGFVERYAVGSSGERIYAVASAGAEPRGLWEYDIKGGCLRKLIQGNKLPFQESFVSEPQEMTFISGDNMRVPAYLFPPKILKKNKKYPLVVYLPPATAQCTRGYELQPQLTANMGFFYLGINYRGVDGYGARYSALKSLDGAAADVISAIQTMRQDPRIDAERIFLVSMSASSEILHKVLTREPRLVRAAVFGSPMPFDLPRETQPKLPPLLVTMGDLDASKLFARELKDWADNNSIPITVSYVPHLGHTDSPDAQARLQQEITTTKFLLKFL